MSNQESLDFTPLIQSKSEAQPTTTQPKHISQFGTTMNLINSLLGAGILSVSNSFTFCGFYPSLALLTLVAGLSYFSAALLAKEQKITGFLTFAEISNITTGKIGSSILSVCVVLFCYSSMIAYLQIGSDTLKSLFDLVNFKINGETGRKLLVLCFSCALPIPMTFPKNLGVLSVVSTFALFGLALFAISIVVKGIIMLPRDGIDKTVENGTFNMGIFNALAVFSLSFAMAVVELPIITASQPKLKGRYQVLGATFLISYTLVMVPGVVGYLIFGKRTNEILFQSFDNRDVLMIFVRIAYFVILVASYPVIGLSVTTTYSRVIFSTSDPSNLIFWRRSVCLLLTNIIPLLLAVLVPRVRPIISIGGAIGGCMTNFLYPSLMWVILDCKNTKWYALKNSFYLFMIFFGAVTTVISTYASVSDLIHEK